MPPLIQHIVIKSLILVSIFLKGFVISIARVAEENKRKSVSNVNRVFSQKFTKNAEIVLNV